MRTIEMVQRSSQRPRPPHRRRASSARRLMWLLLGAALLALPFLSSPGTYVFDTRDSLWFDPGAYLARVGALWWSTPYLGHPQHDGIAVPMGVSVWVLRSVGLPVWAAQRVWHGLLLFSAAGTTILLMDGLRGRKTVLAPLTAGLVYSLTPYSFGYGLPFSGAYIPYVLLPLLLLVTLRGVGERGLLWPALFGLTTFLMGGGNGAPQVLVLLASVGLMAWAVFVERTARLGSAVRFGLASLAFFVGLNASWLLLLSSSQVGNALAFSEQPNVINVSSSASETIRGLGFWQFYGGDQFGPWLPAGRSYVTSLPLIAGGFALAVGALLSAWLARWRFRLFFLFLMVASVAIAVGIFPPGSSTPFGRALLFLYRTVPGAAGLRTTYKVVATLNLSIALLVGFGVGSLWTWLAARRRPRMWRGAAALAVAGAVAASAYPLWAGRLYNPARGVGEIPDYWQQALSRLDREDPRYRVFFAPAMAWATYRWGAIKEGIVATDARLAAITPIPLPVGLRYGSNFLAAVQEPYFNGLSPDGTAQLLRYLGVGAVVLQNDIDWPRSHTARPGQLQLLLGDPDLRIAAAFGAPGESVLVRPGLRRNRFVRIERTLSPVQILEVAHPEPAVRAERPDPIVLSGDGFGIREAAAGGLLSRGPAILYSGALTPAGLDELLSGSGVSFVVTDTNRRRVWDFTGPRPPHSYTLPSGQTLGNRVAGYDLFGGRPKTESVALYPGLEAITASSYGSVFGTRTQFRPSNAFDGDPTTWWVAGVGGDPTGASVQATFARPTTVGSVSISPPPVRWLQPVRALALEFSDGTSVRAPVERSAPTVVTFPPRSTTFLRIRLLEVGRSPIFARPGAGLADVQIPGLHPAELIQVPNDLLDTARASHHGLAGLDGRPLTYLFERSRSGYRGELDEEVGIYRRFEVPGPGPYALSGRVHLNTSAPDDQIDRALFGPLPFTATSSSRLFGSPHVRASAALDGDEETGWSPSRATGESWSVEFPARTIDQIVVDTATAPDRTPILQLHATLSDGRVVRGAVGQVRDGRFTLGFPPTRTSSVTITIDEVFAGGTATPGRIAITEVAIPGLDPLRVDGSARLPCTTGTGFTLDGSFLPVRPRGSPRDLLGGGNVPLEPCHGAPVALDGGWHVLRAGGALQPDTLSLSSGHPGAGATAPLPSVEAASRGDGAFDVRVRAASEPYYLVLGQSFDPGWRASIDGHDLGPPLVLDGYSIGWRIDRPGSYAVAVRYSPQRLYRLALVASVLSLAAALSAVGVHAWRRWRWRFRFIGDGDPPE